MPEPAADAAPNVISETTKEVMFKWVDIVISQSNDLWAICLPFLLASTLVFVHLLGREPTKVGEVTSLPPPVPRLLISLLGISALCSVVSLVMAYKLKGSVVTMLGNSVAAGKWTIGNTAAIDALVQSLSFATAILAFVIAMARYPHLVSRSLINIFTGKQ